MTEEVLFEAEQKHMESTLYGLVGAREPGFDDFLSGGLEKALKMLYADAVSKEL